MTTKIKQLVKNIVRRATGFYELKEELQLIRGNPLQYSDESILSVQRNLAALAQGIADLHLKLAEVTARLDNSPLAGTAGGQSPGNAPSMECCGSGAEAPDANWPVPEGVPLTSCLCTMDRCMTYAYRFWSHKLRVGHLWSWKQWEFHYICQALWERGFLAPGKRGLVFGAGTEPLPALFASMGCSIVATDLPEKDPAVGLWQPTGQHSLDLSKLNDRGICDPEEFQRLVSFEPANMNAIPSHLRGFDFLWTSSSLEHIGSMTKSERFILEAMNCLNDGGVAVHAIPYNVFSDKETIETEDIVLFRKKDILRIAEELHSAGYRLLPVNFHSGNGFLDEFVTYAPSVERGGTYVMVALGGHIFTSIGLIIEKTRSGDS